jgi:hypothetical protein
MLTPEFEAGMALIEIINRRWIADLARRVAATKIPV